MRPPTAWGSRHAPKSTRRRTPQYYLDLGVRHFNLNVDLWILLQWWTVNGKTLRDALPK